MTPTSESFFCPGEHKRPKLEIEIRKCGIEEWKLFSKFHYLNNSLHRAAQCYVGFINDNPVCFAGILHFPHPNVRNFKQVSRVVVLPDYQGLGIGHKFITKIGQAYKDSGNRFILTSSAKGILTAMIKSNDWIVTRKGQVAKGNGSFKDSTSYKKITCSFEYIGRK